VEAIRALMVAKRSARSVRTQTINQARALIITGPDELRARFAGHSPAELVADLASLRPRPGSMVRYHTLLSLRELGRRAQFLDGQLQRLDEFIVPLVTAREPGLLALYGVGPDTAAMLLVAAGDHPERLRSEAAWAHLCATAPLSASSGKVTCADCSLPRLVNDHAPVGLRFDMVACQIHQVRQGDSRGNGHTWPGAAWCAAEPIATGRAHPSNWMVAPWVPAAITVDLVRCMQPPRSQEAGWHRR
jgi:hypothetical protein